MSLEIYGVSKKFIGDNSKKEKFPATPGNRESARLATSPKTTLQNIVTKVPIELPSCFHEVKSVICWEIFFLLSHGCYCYGGVFQS